VWFNSGVHSSLFAVKNADAEPDVVRTVWWNAVRKLSDEARRSGAFYWVRKSAPISFWTTNQTNMRAIVLLTLCLCVHGFAQTNIISFTNSSGTFIQNATAVKIAPNKLMYNFLSLLKGDFKLHWYRRQTVKKI
jgi:hypothetical protein